MLKRLFILTTILLLGVPVWAQNAPEPINAALADLSTRANRNVTLAQVDKWNYQQSVYPSPALGCPQPGVAYADVITSGFQFIITYAGTIYDYRVSDDQSIVILCGTALAPVAAPPCPPPDDTAFLTPRLTKGVQARVVVGDLPNVIRDQPGSSSQLLGQIPPGDSFIVLDGPRCTLLDKIVWWQINYNNLIGWTGEGKDSTYWVEPVDLQSTPTPTFTIEAPVAVTVANAGSMTQLYATNAANPLTITTFDERTLVVGGADGSLMLLDYRTNTEKTKVAAHSGAVTSLVSGVNPSTSVSYIASGGADGIIKIWQVELHTTTLKLLVQISAHTGAVTNLEFDAQCNLLASGGEDKSVRLWRVLDGESLSVLNGHVAAINDLSFHATALLSQDTSGKVMIWGIPSNATSG